MGTSWGEWVGWIEWLEESDGADASSDFPADKSWLESDSRDPIDRLVSNFSKCGKEQGHLRSVIDVRARLRSIPGETTPECRRYVPILRRTTRGPASVVEGTAPDSDEVREVSTMRA
jgi:hypothetical protein